MAKKLILLTQNPEISTIQGIAQHAIGQGVAVEFLDPFNNTNLVDIPAASELWLLPRTSGILFDDIDLHLCEAWIKAGAYCPIPLDSIKKLRDKDRQYLVLNQIEGKELPLVKTLIHRGKLTLDHLKNLSSKESETKEWVVKSIRGNKGIGIEKYTTCELLHFWQEAVAKKDQRYLLQEFIPNAREVRVLALGQKLYAIEKVNFDELNWKKNAQYAKFEKAELTAKESEAFLRYSQIIREELRLPCFAIDLIFNESNQSAPWQILEVNVHPGLDASSEAMGRNLYEEYWNALFSKGNENQEHSLSLSF